MSRQRTPPPERTDSFAAIIGNIVNDVREKLVEEAWYGRTLGGQERQSPAEELKWKIERPEEDRAAPPPAAPERGDQWWLSASNERGGAAEKPTPERDNGPEIER